MTVLITGGCGYIGSHFTWTLHDASIPFVVLDNLSTGFKWSIPDDATLIIGDVGNEDLLDGIIKSHNIDSIVHFAGSIIVPESLEDPLKYYFNNTSKTRNLIASAVRNKVKNFVFSSTAAVYGNPEHTPVNEDDRLNPISPYGSSKLMSEIMIRDTSLAKKLNYAILRYFNVAGADPQTRTGQSTKGATHLIKVAIESHLGLRPKLEIYGSDYDTRDGTCIRDYIHVSDLASAHLHALNHLSENKPSFTANCGYGRGYSVLDVISSLEKVTKKNLPYKFSARRPGDPADLIADVSRIHSLLDWKPMYDNLETVIQHALQWEIHLQNLKFR